MIANGQLSDDAMRQLALSEPLCEDVDFPIDSHELYQVCFCGNYHHSYDDCPGCRQEYENYLDWLENQRRYYP